MRFRTLFISPIVDTFRIRRSGLFQLKHYRSQFYKELKADRFLLRLFPVLHYVLFGARARKNPNALFDTEYYLEHNGKDIPSGQNPLAHFILHGARERLDPGPSFDTVYYLEQNPDVAASGFDPLRHYLAQGRYEGRKPHPLFAALDANPAPNAVSCDQGREWLRQGLGPCGDGAPRRVQRTDRVIRFEWDRGGWNNIRMQAEVMVGMAERFGRALVLPGPEKWYLIPGDESHLFDFYDETAFRSAVAVLPPDTRPEDEWVVPANLAAINTVRLDSEAYLRQQDRESWYFPKSTRMFGRFGSILGSDAGLYDRVRRAFRVRSDLLDTTMALLEEHGLKPGAYLAAHVRRGDFQQMDMRYLSVENIVESFRRHGADAAGTVLIVSDEYDEELLDACRNQGWEPVCWATRQVADPRFSGVLDMLCCCPGWRFVGTNLSTFSTGIMQWRGYVSRVAGGSVDATPRFTSDLEQTHWWGEVDELAWLTT